VKKYIKIKKEIFIKTAYNNQSDNEIFFSTLSLNADESQSVIPSTANPLSDLEMREYILE
jgi:hypothetical protein